MASWLSVRHRPSELAFGALTLSVSLENEIRDVWAAQLAIKELEGNETCSSPITTVPPSAVSSPVFQRDNGSRSPNVQSPRVGGQQPNAVTPPRGGKQDPSSTGTTPEALRSASQRTFRESLSPMNHAQLKRFADDDDTMWPANDDPEFQEEGYLRCRKGDILNGNYLIVRELGVGQSSRVYLARNLSYHAANNLAASDSASDLTASSSLPGSPVKTMSRQNSETPSKQSSAVHFDDASPNKALTPSGIRDRDRHEFVALKVYRCEGKLVDSMHYEKMLLEYIIDRLKHIGIRDAGVSHMLEGFVHSGEHGAHPCLVFEVLGSALDSLMEEYEFQGITDMQIVRQVLVSSLVTLEHLDRFNVIHTDLKPENMLLAQPSSGLRRFMRRHHHERVAVGNLFENEEKEGTEKVEETPTKDAVAEESSGKRDYRVKIVDFGLSYVEPPHVRRQGMNNKKLGRREQELLYVGNYQKGTCIQTREYRAPEIILGQDFTTKADVWSIGCVAYELVTGRFLFDPKSKFVRADEGAEEYFPTEEELDAQHLRDIAAFWSASPPAEMLKREGVHTGKYYSRTSFRYTRWEPTATRTQIEAEVFRAMSTKAEALEFMNFVKACVHWDPHQRSSPTTLLKHRWLTGSTSNDGSPRHSTRR